MNIHQFYDEGLSHASYAIYSDGQMALIDPARNPEPYLDFAREQGATISIIVETHPHADFVSSHTELHRLTGATIYTSRLSGAEYPHEPFDDGDRIGLGKVWLEALNTPGHSPDSICVLLRDSNDQPQAVFTGDTLFVGDVGRPDLRENVGHITAKAEALARELYHSLRKKLLTLPENVRVYPAHGPGSLCGKNMGSDLSSTIGREAASNYALQPMSEDEFVALLLEQQPFVPRYFPFDVALNKRGAGAFGPSTAAIPRLDTANLESGTMVVDGRQQGQFKAGHLPGAFNIPDGLRFETWLGTIIGPGEPFYLLTDNAEALQLLIEKAAKIGYEQFIKGGVLFSSEGPMISPPFNAGEFVENPDSYTILDIRSTQEAADRPIFKGAINIPLPELRDRIHQIPVDKPVAVHCAGGYRSAIGSSLVAAALPSATVLDIGNHILDLIPVK
ncbi:Glyoxylase, beta-lactamase superfamily II [Parapedobacter composti]|uniref:Glyoxylase, beta-lactamase superfamily II n=1 Tax=Parapedobacter composti TaxID=623281 RepID=A0A1I1KX80_9SPHI|nr:MBL fold metallo-hydrolase [Parapedobacter composti]SFC62020.1 Glyoxylase, beta-lactamase superfamily II [Parapedobacter composti]